MGHPVYYADMDYWLTTGREELYRSVEKTSTLSEGVAKNVILFVGRGMGVSTVTASRIYKAQGLNSIHFGILTKIITKKSWQKSSQNIILKIRSINS